MKLHPVNVRERGPTPRKMRKSMTTAKRHGWREASFHFHANLRDKRFTQEHAREAGYLRRSKEYTERKQQLFGHRNPLEFTGETRRAVRMGRVSSTTKLGRIAYPGARKFNFRNSRSQIRMQLEFRKITRREAREIAGVFDKEIDRRLNIDQTTDTRVLR